MGEAIGTSGELFRVAGRPGPVPGPADGPEQQDQRYQQQQARYFAGIERTTIDMTYGGLGQYSGREKPDKWARREGESEESAARRSAFWRRSEATVDEADWEAHRALVSQQGTGAGLYGHSTPQERSAGLSAPGAVFGGEQRVEKLGGIVSSSANAIGQTTIARVFPAQIAEREAELRRQQHVPIAGRASGEGWSTTRG